PADAAKPIYCGLPRGSYLKAGVLEWRSGGVLVGASEFGIRSCECGIGYGRVRARAELINC
ncbi:MAG TPA: hypothetical protein VN281_14965, partial [Verrucomicrobiae bacterium]|nr:hypothetical protein [Verrucomicrobiae bacterium]